MQRYFCSLGTYASAVSEVPFNGLIETNDLTLTLTAIDRPVMIDESLIWCRLFKITHTFTPF